MRPLTAFLIALACACPSAARPTPEHPAKPMIKTEDVHIRDPFVVPVKDEGKYYMYGTTAMARPHGGFSTYASSDLKVWEGPIDVFVPHTGFWGDRTFWAAEVHPYRGRYYMFATFGAEKVLRATQILVSQGPRGPFKPLTDRPVTPFGWQCLDGTLFIDDDDKPWIVFCHEWEQVGDGEICAMRLTDDLKYSAGDPVLLFRASEAPWMAKVPWVKEDDRKTHITDGPFLHRLSSGKLIMLWSSFGRKGYVQAIALSETGKITGPWRQDPKLVYDKDGGHGMLFRTFEGRLMLTLHTPNGGGKERAAFFPAVEKSDRIEILTPPE